LIWLVSCLHESSWLSFDTTVYIVYYISSAFQSPHDYSVVVILIGYIDDFVVSISVSILQKVIAGECIAVDEIQREPKMVRKLIGDVCDRWMFNVPQLGFSPRLILTGTPVTGADSVHLTQHELSKSSQFFIPPFSVLELKHVLDLVFQRSVSLSQIWRIWSFFDGVPAFYHRLYTAGKLDALVASDLHPVNNSDLQDVFLIMQSEFNNLHSHVPLDAIELLQSLDFDITKDKRTEIGLSYLREKQLITVRPALKSRITGGKTELVKSKTKRGHVKSGFLRNLVKFNSYESKDRAVPCLEGDGLESLVNNVLEESYFIHKTNPFPFNIPVGAVVEPIQLDSLSRDLDIFWKMGTNGNWALVAFNIKRISSDLQPDQIQDFVVNKIRLHIDFLHSRNKTELFSRICVVNFSGIKVLSREDILSNCEKAKQDGLAKGDHNSLW